MTYICKALGFAKLALALEAGMFLIEQMFRWKRIQAHVAFPYLFELGHRNTRLTLSTQKELSEP